MMAIREDDIEYRLKQLNEYLEPYGYEAKLQGFAGGTNIQLWDLEREDWFSNIATALSRHGVYDVLGTLIEMIRALQDESPYRWNGIS